MNAGSMGMAVNQKSGLGRFQGCLYRELVDIHNSRCLVTFLDVASKSYGSTNVVSLADAFFEERRSPLGLVHDESKFLMRFVVCTQSIAVKKKYLPAKKRLNRSIR
jgi:hypothetical protein